MFENDYLMHYGIKGQKWGVRRYQNADGSLTTAGRARYSKGSGKRARYGSENTMDADKAARVEKLNKKIDKLNLKMQKGTARSYGYGDLSVGKQAALAGGLGAGLGGAAMYSTASKAAKAYNKLNGENIVKGYQWTNDANGNTVLAPAIVSGASKINPVAAGLKAAIPYATAVGLTNAAGGAILGAAAKGFGSHDVFRKGREQKIKKLQYERDALDSSQKNRKGRILTQEEFNKQFNGAKGGITGLNLGGLVGGAVGAAIGKRSKRDNAYEYEQYKKNAVAYGKKPKYGSAYNALDAAKEKKVAKLNKKIDNRNLAYQMGLAVRDSESYSPFATRMNEKLNVKNQKALTKLVAKRNALDPSQANRQGRLLTNDEYNKYYNMGKHSTAAQLAFGLPGAVVNAVAGSRSKKTHDAEYENYKNSAVSYGSKKKKRAR